MRYTRNKEAANVYRRLNRNVRRQLRRLSLLGNPVDIYLGRFGPEFVRKGEYVDVLADTVQEVDRRNVKDLHGA